MVQPRRVLPETLDELGPNDPRALRSRADLRRINGVMGSRAIMLDALAPFVPPRGRSTRVLELGAGDGTLMVGVAARLAAWGRVDFDLLDQYPIVSEATTAAYAAHGWRARALTCDITTWIDVSDGPWDVIVTNLFLHHFEGAALERLLAAIAPRCQLFVAAEPRRSALALLGSRLVGMIGANDVTRADAVLSVKAGFRDDELSEIWPACATWQIEERPARLFTHFFRASRTPAH